MAFDKEAEASIAIGVDLGGTKVEAAAVFRSALGKLDVLERRRVPTNRQHGYEAVLDTTAGLIVEMARHVGADIAKVPIGMGMPGGTTRRFGLVKNSNTVCLNDRPFRSDLERTLGRSIAFDNDANCFALAEALSGAATPYRAGVVFGVILGTGVGGGIIIDGKIWEGSQGIAGEWGHHAVFADRDLLCYCGKRGCMELYASGPAVEGDYARRSGTRLSLAEIVLLREVDAHASKAIEGLVDAFGRGLANVINILDPSAIVIGGGVSNLDLLYEEGVQRIGHYLFNDELTTPILRHSLGDSAGVLGAALIARSGSPTA